MPRPAPAARVAAPRRPVPVPPAPVPPAPVPPALVLRRYSHGALRAGATDFLRVPSRGVRC